MSLDKYGQNIAFQSNWFKEEKEYWLKSLAGKGQGSSFSFQAPTFLKDQGCSLFSFELPPIASEKLFKLSNRNEEALFVALFSAVAYLLSRYNRSKDILISLPSLERSPLTDAHIFPLFLNLKEGMTYKDLLMAVKEGVLAVNRYNNIAPAKILQELNGESADGELHKTLVLLENIHGAKRARAVPYDLCLSFLNEEDKIRADISYRSSLFKREYIERLSGHLLCFYAEVLGDYNRPLDSIEILTPKEREKILIDFNSSYRDYSQAVTPKELFETQVEKTPHRPAVVGGNSSLTYKELNEKANSLAGLLVRKGVKPNDLIGLRVGRGVEMLVGLWSILKAGAAYLPIELACPPNRLAYILKDSKAKLLLTDGEVSGIEAVEILDLRDENLYGHEKTNLSNIAKGKDLAYLIYTSGSGGEPKGVMIENHSVTSLVRAMEKVVYGRYGEGLRVAMVAPLIFDSSVEVIFAALSLGHTLYIVPEGTRFDGQELIDFYRNNSIAISDGTPAHVNLMVNAPVSYDGLAVQVFIIGGEEFKKELLLRFLARFPRNKPTLINSYGPTECCSDATTFTIDNKSTDLSLDSIPIGKPLTNTKIFILSPTDKLQPIGVPGVLCIGGAGLARGYLNKPLLSEASFVANPLLPGEKMYKSGDLACWREDGNIEFLGRLDRQVQFKGYRIELGEIENILLAYPGIREAVAMVRKAKEDQDNLWAFYTADREFPSRDLKDYLAEYLPAYMLPSFLVHRKEIPLTANGKIDFEALAGSLEYFPGEDGYLAPRNELEERLVCIWQEELGLERVGVLDNFFAVGGDSLGAMKIYGRLADEFPLSLADIFKYQDIASLAANLFGQKDYLKKKIAGLEIGRSAGQGLAIYSDYKKEYRKYTGLVKDYKQMPLEPFKFQNVFLTGATGYLGNYILYELLIAGNCHIHLFLRGPSKKIIEKRLREITDHYHGAGFYERFKDRLSIVRGDLREENLGLWEDEILSLKDKIDYIIHAAADVRHFGPYRDFYGTNVLGTARIIDLALAGQAQLGYISTMSLGFADAKEGCSFFSEFDKAKSSANYYLQSKILTENMLLAAQGKGLEYKIFRVGNLVFDSKNGSFQRNIAANAFYSLLKAFWELGLIPRVNAKVLDFSFVDYAAKAVVLLSSLKAPNSVYHVFNKYRLSPVRLAGYLDGSVEVVEAAEFLAKLTGNLTDGGLNENTATLLMYQDLLNDLQKGTFFGAGKTEMLLKRLDFQWPRVERKHIMMMVDHCQEVGFFAGKKT